jgi:sigma-B regulation protein RsbU (phosphoserine phosphatase)
MKLRRILYIGTGLLLILVTFTIDVIRRNVELEIGGLSFIRDLLVLGVLLLVYLTLEQGQLYRGQNPIRKLGLAMVSVIVLVVVGGIMVSIGVDGFDTKNYTLLPLSYGTLFSASLVGVVFAIGTVVNIRLLRDLVMYKRKRGTQRNYYMFIGLMLAAAVSSMMTKPLEANSVTGLLFGFAIIFVIVNAFRLSWIVYLTKREKILSLVYSFFLFLGFLFINILVLGSPLNKSLLYYSAPLKQVVALVSIFGNVYFGMAFISTLFHIPTAEAFDRKTTEVSSLHNLSRLVTQVFDFKELVDTVTAMTLQVCEAKSCWLEIIQHDGQPTRAKPDGTGLVLYSSSVGDYHVQVASMKNITQNEIDVLLAAGERTLRDVVLEERTALVIDDVKRDSRFKHLGGGISGIGSLVVVPLVSHSGLIGILYATKDMEYGFFKDDVNVISAFADQATIAIENARLIAESLERERLLREMMVAQEMQRKLLPQSLPQFPHLELDAMSTPAFEVGGDYYDVVHLDDHRLGIIVGDVSGKGVSAAFYMSEVKGIFQALGKLYTSPREFMVKANETLARSIDRRSFVSLIYAVIDMETGALVLARAGHCPMLLLSEEKSGFVRPGGMGLGLDPGDVFAGSIEEHTLTLRPGDVCILYTDGVTEARYRDDEFGYERLLQTAEEVRHEPASFIKDHIVNTVRGFVQQEANHDDLTLVVMKWRGMKV